MAQDPNFPHVDVPDDFQPTDDMQGWLPQVDTENEKRAIEAGEWDKVAHEQPFQMQTQEPITQALLDKWVAFQKEHGRHEPCNDMLLLDKFAYGKQYTFSYQPIGNCVAANSVRPWTTRSIYQSVFYSGERLGNDEFGPNSVAPSVPAAYGFMRQQGNMRGRGDGGFGSAMAKAYVRDGIIKCSNETLRGIIGDNDRDYPEMSSQSSKYKRFGRWMYNDDLRPHLTNKCEECFKVDTLEQLWDALMQGKPCFVCSSFGWKHRGRHRDGFPLGIRSGTWHHNMGIEGCFTTSSGDRVFCWHTLSWARSSEQKWIFYAVWDRRLERDFARMDCYAIGQISGLESHAPTM